MVELSVRLVLSGALVFAAGITAGQAGGPGFAFAAGLAAVHAAFGGLLNRLEVRGLLGPRTASIVGAIDAALIAALLVEIAPQGILSALAPFALLGPALAIRLRGAHPWAYVGAPVAIAGALAVRGEIAPLPVIAAGLAALLAVLGQTKPLIVRVPVAGEAKADEEKEDEVLLELRMAFRKLREAYRDLERDTRKDRLFAGLGEARLNDVGTPFERIAERLRKLSGADGLALYTVAQYEDLFVVRAAVGDLPASQGVQNLEVRARQAAGVVREQADVLLSAMRGGEPGTNVPLLHEGRVVGVLAASLKDANSSAAEVLEQAAPWVAALVVDQARRESVERRLKETELLYGLATGTDGATGRTDMAARAVHDLKEITGADHVSISLIDGARLTRLAGEGIEAPILEAMSFAHGPGIAGWLGVGSPELVLADVRGDARCASEGALRARIGSFVAIPLTILGEIGAVLVAATSRVGGLDVPQIEALRAAGAELGRRFGRPLPVGEDSDGLMLPTEFATRLLRGGALVTLEPLRLDAHEASFGKPAIAHALRTLSHRVKARLPEGAAACRTGEGRILVWLPSAKESEAISWANEMAAVASMIGLRTPDGTRRIPIALRAKAALLEHPDPQGPGSRGEELTTSENRREERVESESRRRVA